MTAPSITTPQGFTAAFTTAGIKPSGKSDMALVVNNGPLHVSAAVFTRNKITASPVRLTQAHCEKSDLHAVVYNSGNANACNGSQGDADATSMAEQVAHNLGLETEMVGVCSTGLIGDVLPMNKVSAGISTLTSSLGAENGHGAAEAIMTTDTVSKEAFYQGDGWCLAGMGKGVGMMAPSLATMLVCLTTDAVIDPPQELLRSSTASTFDCVDIDGTTSTNDTLILLGSGASGISPSEEEFATAVQQVCTDLARKMQADAEGVTKEVTITVTGAQDYEQAKAAARTVGRDNLFKCAMFGSDPNWGRVLAAVGMAPVELDPTAISVSFNGQKVCEKSTGVPGAREVDLSNREINVTIDLGVGEQEATLYTTDLSYQYVEINSEYST